MNTGRFVGAVIAVWIVRTVMNFLFYGVAMTGVYEALTEAHPGIFREVIPAYIIADLLFACLFVYLFARAGQAFGGGAGGGMRLGVVVALISPVLGFIYQFFSVTYMSGGLVLGDIAYQLVAHAIVGAVAGAVYRPDGAGPV